MLGATQDEVLFERAILVSPPDNGSTKERIFLEYRGGDDEASEPAPADDQPKAGRVLGVPGEQNLEWLNRRSGSEGSPRYHRRVPSKALLTLGATIDDVRIEKALLVLGEAPGRQIPGGKLPRPASLLDEDETSLWAVAPALEGVHSGVSVFLCAFLPWGVLAPLNVLKLQLNKARAAEARAAQPSSALSASPRSAWALSASSLCCTLHPVSCLASSSPCHSRDLLPLAGSLSLAPALR